MDVYPPKNAIPNLKKSSLLMAQLFKFVALTEIHYTDGPLVN